MFTKLELQNYLNENDFSIKTSLTLLEDQVNRKIKNLPYKIIEEVSPSNKYSMHFYSLFQNDYKEIYVIETTEELKLYHRYIAFLKLIKLIEGVILK